MKYRNPSYEHPTHCGFPEPAEDVLFVVAMSKRLTEWLRKREPSYREHLAARAKAEIKEREL